MILRRVIEHVKAQHWTVVFLDFVIVVLGVFIGLQVQDWNAARNARADAREYRERLITDMQLSVSRNQAQIDYGRRQIDQLDLVLAALTSCHLDADKEGVFDAGLYNMGKFDLPTMVMGTIDELNATGDFPLIGDPALRRTISETVRVYRTEFAIEPQLTGRIVPHVNYVRSRVRFILGQNSDYPPAIDPDKVFYDFDKLCSDEKFINAVAAVREMTLVTDGLNQEVLDRQSKLLTELKRAP
ncbi:MAG: hypothetical protein WB812_15570 [Woeseiaceae bacterium]